ncbi:hypothetical protein Poli38472_014492 [Pythium oligandrum]|uniref:Uncharacterized protein n=1 Tax=Pythium oligandrum TaxID=41045 RepID=A0A8K1CDS6_PYTOL|nr:hypothetical protein Poli38472_014492 [Pythium oligandrum]|eukprot:TMW61031.1 hypothetical protein Poli38472_014492 [Pythium oligandrum]
MQTTTKAIDELGPGARVQGYELVERTAQLGVCNHRPPQKQIATDDTRWGFDGVLVAVDGDEAKRVVAVRKEGEDSAVVEVEVDPLVCALTTSEERPSSSTPSEALIKDGPSLEYQCLLDDIDLIYVNSNYRLKKKFAAGSHGEVWRATRPSLSRSTPETFILKRLFVEKGEMMVEMGLREAHFGAILAKEAHVTGFVEYFFRDSAPSGIEEAKTAPLAPASPKRAPPPLPAADASSASTTSSSGGQELWLVFHDEGISLRQYLYASLESAQSAVLLEPSPFWERLRLDTRGEDVLREILRQLLEGVAALHDRGITHRDIKPSNILVHTEVPKNINDSVELPLPVVKLADFGSAVDAYTLRHLYGEQGPTQAEETREYQPPEVLFSEYGVPYDSAWPLAYDLWSVGVVFLEMVLGSPQVFMITPRARAKLDVHLRGKDEATKRKSYLLHVLTHEFCIYQPSSHELHALWNQYALVNDGCHFGKFNTTIVERDPKHKGLSNRWGLDLMWKLLQWNPSQRISAREALQHAFFQGPYMSTEDGRRFATKHELDLHEAYLSAQYQQHQDRAFVVREKYETPDTFQCPHCHRNFSTISSCEHHVAARKHNQAAGTHFCKYNQDRLQRSIQLETKRFSNSSLWLDGSDKRVGVALLQGKKKYMEDMVTIHYDGDANFTMYAVIDGHLGTRAASYVQDHVGTLISERFQSANVSATSGATREFLEHVLLRQVFLELHEGYIADQRRVDESIVTHDFSGCTLSVVIIFHNEGRLLSANVGDSRAIFVESSDDPVQQLTTDHWPNAPEEKSRIESSGGFVSFQGLWRVVGQLAVSRSIGDQHLRKYVSAEPSIFRLNFEPGTTGPKTLVVASDGIWETMSNEDVSTFVLDKRHQDERGTVQSVAEDLIGEAYLRGSLDNLAAIIVNL